MSMKQVINLVFHGKRLTDDETVYRVTSLTNRLEPQVGDFLSRKQVDKLLFEVQQSDGALIVNIREK